jgi:hypothetical protein
MSQGSAMSDKWWELEIEMRAPDPAARLKTVLRWMLVGEYRPLAAALRDRVMFDIWCDLLADHIETGEFRKRRRGGQRKPEASVRDTAAAILYEHGKGSFEEIAKRCGMSEAAVRKAVTKHRREEAMLNKIVGEK